MDRMLLIDLLIVASILALVIATITDISYGIGKSTSRFSHDHPYVTAKWTDPASGRSYTFWQLAAENKPSYKIGNLVPILIDPNHPHYYEMEI